VILIPVVHSLAVSYGRDSVVDAARVVLDRLRQEITSGLLDEDALELALSGLAGAVANQLRQALGYSLRSVINATGVILHTNLGRAPLGEAAIEHIRETAASYSNLEFDVSAGARGKRDVHVERLFQRLLTEEVKNGAQRNISTIAVNNNAAAVLLALNTLADGGEVIVSRGELVEIGGSFRIPDIMRKSGAILREVGTTNRTRIQDYERAIGDRTGLLLKVHPSNYRIVGFTAEVPLAAVAQLGRRRRLPVLMDQGSGNLLDLTRFGIRGEPSVQEALADGADLVCCSGDKLLGGPQAGLLVGRPPLIRRTRENPLSRALRIDKLTYAALEATLLEHARGAPQEGLPTLRMIALGREAVEARARLVAERVGRKAGGALELRVEPGESLLGGGSAPQEGLPTSLITVRAPSLSSRSLEERLRRFDPPVLGRIEGRRLILDLRTVPPEQDDTIVAALLAAATDPEARTRH